MNVLVTAGPTREPIDPVRYLSNRSSGRMGYALAAAAREAGHAVLLITGPVSIDPPSGTELLPVQTAEEMLQAVAGRTGWANVMILAAAVADYRPRARLEHKLKKTGAPLTLELVPTPDVLGSLRHPLGYAGYLAGFAAETGDLEANARSKLERKGCDLIVANDVSGTETGIDSEDNEVLLLFRSGARRHLPRAPKTALAREIWRAIEADLASIRP